MFRRKVPPGSIKGGDYLNQLNNCLFLCCAALISNLYPETRSDQCKAWLPYRQGGGESYCISTFQYGTAASVGLHDPALVWHILHVCSLGHVPAFCCLFGLIFFQF
jgi:hypothetical protein